jgi:hypothetical protein
MNKEKETKLMENRWMVKNSDDALPKVKENNK